MRGSTESVGQAHKKQKKPGSDSPTTHKLTHTHHALRYSARYESTARDSIQEEESLTMTAQARNLWGGVIQTLVVAGISVVCSTILLASKLEERVAANKDAARTELAAAIAVRKAEQNVLAQDVDSQKAVLREMADMLKGIANGQKITQESVARLEERVSYLAKGQEEIKLQLIRK